MCIRDRFYGDKTRIAQVIENIVSNSIKYMDKNKDTQFVDIDVSDSGTDIQIRITDNGLGIPDKFHNELFTMFKRFHPDVASGSGLGLSIVQKNVDNMGGTIDIASSSAGTTFSIRIPRGASSEKSFDSNR